MRIFLTGATGVVGIRAIPRLVAAGHRVTGLGRSPKSRRQLAQLGAEPIELDLFQPEAVIRAVEKHDVVINLATHIPASMFQMVLPGAWRETDRLRRDGSMILARAARQAGARRFLQESFGPIYQAAGDRWIDEQWPVRPVRYNRSVLDAERTAQWFTEQGGIGVALRFAGFYGPDAFGQTFIKSVRRGWSPLPGPPDAFFSSVSQDDAAS